MNYFQRSQLNGIELLSMAKLMQIKKDKMRFRSEAGGRIRDTVFMKWLQEKFLKA